MTPLSSSDWCAVGEIRVWNADNRADTLFETTWEKWYGRPPTPEVK
jgi:hypothetical protein